MTRTRRVAITNQKGGVGKTTTTVNLGAGLAKLGQRVLICDLDPQCNLTVHVNCDPNEEGPNLYELLHGRTTVAEAARPIGVDGMEVLPAHVDLAGAEVELASELGREVILRNALDEDNETRAPAYDFVLVDCPPSLGLLALNSMVACDEVFVPIQAEFFALQGLGKLMDVVRLIQNRLNPSLAITGMFSCRHDPTTNLGKAVMEDIQKHFGDVVMETVIRRNVKLAEAPSHGMTIFDYDEESRGAEDYMALAREVLGVNTEPSPAEEISGTEDVSGGADWQEHAQTEEHTPR